MLYLSYLTGLRTFLADNAGIGLPLGIERVIRIGSKEVWQGKIKEIQRLLSELKSELAQD